MDHDPKPPPPAEESWTAIALRDPGGLYLARGITWRVAGVTSPFQAETWPDEVEMRVWLADRLASYRRDIDNGGYAPFPLICRAAAMPGRAGAGQQEHDETRPLVAEAACDA